MAFPVNCSYFVHQKHQVVNVISRHSGTVLQWKSVLKAATEGIVEEVQVTYPTPPVAPENLSGNLSFIWCKSWFLPLFYLLVVSQIDVLGRKLPFRNQFLFVSWFCRGIVFTTMVDVSFPVACSILITVSVKIIMVLFIKILACL